MATDPMAGEVDESQAEKTMRGRPMWRSRRNGQPAGGGAVYGLGMIGAMVYFLRSAESGSDYLMAMPKASVWPALVVFKVLQRFYG